MDTTPAPTVIRRRPTPVTILAVIQAIGATGYLVSFAAIAGAQLNLLASIADRGLRVFDEASIDGLAVAGIILAMAVVGYAASILLFRMRQVGWTLTMLLAGWSLASQIYLYVTTADIVPSLMLVSVVIVLYLNQRQVRVAFGIGAPTMSVPDLDERA